MLLLTVLAGWCVLAMLLAPLVGRMIADPRRAAPPLRDRGVDRCYTRVVPVPRAPRRPEGERSHACVW